MRSVSSVLGILLCVAGCSSSTIAPQLIAGPWHETFSIAGSFFQMDLTVTGSSVLGSGYGCGEAGPCATSQITGTTDASGVHLDFVVSQTNPQPSGPLSTFHFDGQLIGKVMRGTVRSAAPSAPAGPEYTVTYERGLVFDPLLR
jgi:hypothetical protein